MNPTDHTTTPPRPTITATHVGRNLFAIGWNLPDPPHPAELTQAAQLLTEEARTCWATRWASWPGIPRGATLTTYPQAGYLWRVPKPIAYEALSMARTRLHGAHVQGSALFSLAGELGV